MSRYHRTLVPVAWWTLILLSIPGSRAQEGPRLLIERSDPGLAIISWPDTGSDFILESVAGGLAPAQFRPVPLPATDVGGRRSMTVALGNRSRFFRLRSSSLSLTINDGVTVDAGGTVPLTSAMLSVSSSATPPEEIVFTLIDEGYSGLLSGHVAFTDDAGQAITRFTQADLDAGRVVYQDGVNDVILQEVKADCFFFSVSDSTGADSGLRSFMVLRNPPGSGPDDGAQVWRASDGGAFLDGGPGDDALILRGSDDVERVTVRPSPDGTQIVITVNGGEPVMVDGIEDLYFVMGNGDNSVELSGDFSATDLSPATIFYFGGPGEDVFDDEDPGANQWANDYVLNLFDGYNRVRLERSRGTLIIGGNHGESIRVIGREGFLQHVFAKAGFNTLDVRPRGLLHLDERGANVEHPTGSICLIDFQMLVQMFRNAEPFIISGPTPPGQVFLRFGPGFPQPLTLLGIQDSRPIQDVPIGFLAHEPAPGSTQLAQWEPLNLIDAFVNDPTAPPFPFPATTAYRIASGENYLAVDPGMPNAVIGFELSTGSIETLTGSEFDDLIFAGDNPAVADEDLEWLPPDGDTLIGLRGNDWMVGDRLNNFFDGGRGDDRMEGRGGDDTFVWSLGNDFIDGGEGYDVADYTDDPLDGDDGIRVSPNQDGSYSVFYGDDNFATDTLVDIEEVRGTPHDDEMVGGSFVGVEIAARFASGGGNDRLVGGLGNDYLDGGPGDDLLEGLWGDDILIGHIGADTLDGGPGQDRIEGGGGDDLGIFRLGETGMVPDEYEGGPGNDTLRVVILDPLAVSSAQVSELTNLQNQFTASISFPELKLTISGWEALEILDHSGNAVNPNDLVQNPPTDILLSNSSVDEETPGAFIGELSVEDPNNVIGDSHTFDLNDARFEVRDGNALFLVVGARLDFEIEPDVSLNIGATDRGGNRIERAFTIQVNDLPDTPMAPTDLRLSHAVILEEFPGAGIGFVEVDDLNPNEQHNFSITVTSPAGSTTQFEVEGGILKLADADSVDFETQPGFGIEITVEDKDGLTFTKSFTLTAMDIDENVPAPSLPTNHFELINGIKGFGFHHSFLVPEVTSGVSIASAGDVTHDGIEDLVVTSTVGSGPFSNFAFLIPGADTGFPHPLFRSSILGGSDLSDRGGTTILLPDSDDRNRSAVAAGIGDFNGDGRDDLVFGSGKAESSDSDFEAGQVMIVMGRPGGLPSGLNIDVDLTDSSTFDGAMAFRIEGAETHERFGTTAGPAGDVDGDGFDDVLIGIGAFPDEFTDGGAVILYGRGATFPPSQESSVISGLRFSRISSGSVTSIGDINGDGHDDLFVTLSNGAENGAILFGQAGGLPELIDPTTDHDVLIRGGLNRGIETLHGVAGAAGDLNSDGFEDLFLLTQPGSAPATLNNELVVLYGGNAFPETIDLGDNHGDGPNGASPIAYLGGGTRGVQILPGGDFGRPAGADSSFVTGVTGSGDVNGDGNDDLLFRLHNSATLRQEHAVVFGSAFLPDILVIDSAGLPAEQGAVFGFATDPAYGFDQGIGGLIDLNGDGFHDLAFADPATDLGFGNIVSMAYVLFGGDFGGLPRLKGTAGDDFLLGGRMTDDIFIGGPGNDTLVGLGSRDVFYGGTGDDLIVVGGIGIPEYVRIDGGAGTDTVRLDSLGMAGNNLVWDLQTSSNSPLNPAGNHLVASIEIIDLGLGGPADRHKLILALDDLVDLPEDDRSLTIIGDASDSLTFAGSLTFSRAEMRQGINFDVYAVDGTNLELLIAAAVPFE